MFPTDPIICPPITCTPPKMEPNRNMTLHESVRSMASNAAAQSFAKDEGMSINTVTWEDCGRFKNSCWGPNISDMTLQVRDEKGEYHAMPVIRRDNMSDLTRDVPLEHFALRVGNESGAETLTKMTLRQYLEEISKHIFDGTIKGSMLCDKDTHVIHSVQSCMLPAEEGKDCRFNVALFNYQSTKEHPAVLTLVVSKLGTSAQIIDNGGNFSGQKLMFNKNGDACDFKAERLKDVRAQAGTVVNGAMSDEEDENTRLYIIQIPLKVPERPRPMYNLECAFMPAACCMSMPKSAGMDYAQIKVGEVMGPYHGLNDLTIERDPQFPIRVTEQLYKVVSSGNINREEMNLVTKDIKASEEKGKNASSLVFENTNRPTEWTKV